MAASRSGRARLRRDRPRAQTSGATGSAAADDSTLAGGYFTAELRVPEEIVARLRRDDSPRLNCCLAITGERLMPCAVAAAAPVRSHMLTTRVFRARVEVPHEALPPARRGIDPGATFLLFDRDRLFFLADGTVLTPVVREAGPPLWG